MVFSPPTDRLRIERDPDDENGALRPIGEVVANLLTEGARAIHEPLPGAARLARLAREARAKAGLGPCSDLLAVRPV